MIGAWWSNQIWVLALSLLVLGSHHGCTVAVSLYTREQCPSTRAGYQLTHGSGLSLFPIESTLRSYGSRCSGVYGDFDLKTRGAPFAASGVWSTGAAQPALQMLSNARYDERCMVPCAVDSRPNVNRLCLPLGVTLQAPCFMLCAAGPARLVLPFPMTTSWRRTMIDSDELHTPLARHSPLRYGVETLSPTPRAPTSVAVVAWHVKGTSPAAGWRDSISTLRTYF